MHPRFPIGRLQGGAGRLPAAANAPKIPNWKASRRCGQAARSSDCAQDSQLDAGRLPAAANAPKIPNWKASRRCGQAARSSERTQDSQLEGFKAVRGRLPAAANAPNIPNCGRLQGGAGRQPAAVTAHKIPHWKDSRRCGQAARSSECTQDSQLEGFKAVRAGCPQQRAGRLQGGAGLLPAAANAQIPDWKSSRRCGQAARSNERTEGSQLEGLKAVRAGCPQQRPQDSPVGRLQGGAGRIPAAANAPKIPLWKASRRCGQAVRSSEGTQDAQLEGFNGLTIHLAQLRKA